MNGWIDPNAKPQSSLGDQPSSAGSYGKSPRARSMSNVAQPKVLTPFVPKKLEDIEERVHPKILLLENINQSAVEMFRQQGYTIETETGALAEADLISRLVKGNFTAVGIRSKTKVTAKVIESVKNVCDTPTRP